MGLTPPTQYQASVSCSGNPLRVRGRSPKLMQFLFIRATATDPDGNNMHSPLAHMSLLASSRSAHVRQPKESKAILTPYIKRFVQVYKAPLLPNGIGGAACPLVQSGRAGWFRCMVDNVITVESGEPPLNESPERRFVLSPPIPRLGGGRRGVFRLADS